MVRYLLDAKKADKVWLVVSPCNPLKRRDELLDGETRRHMLGMAVADCPNTEVSDVEFSMPVPSYTVDTLRVLSRQHPEERFALLIGSDNALTFDRWKEYNRILTHYPVLVYPRRGYDFSQVAHKYPQMQLLSSPYYDISSTSIREGIARGEDMSAWLHPLVWQYIRENKLYHT